MAVQGTDYEILLKMRADMAQAMNALNGVQQQLRKTSDSASVASRAASATAATLDSLDKRAAAVGSSLKKMAATLVTAFAVKELASFVKGVIDLDAQIGDMSKKVGVSTETLSALGQVARRNGADLDAVKTGFVQLAKAATDSSSKGAKALQAMGIPLKEFLALKPADQFDLVAQKFAGYEDGARKAALATALFGKTGADLIPTLNDVGQQGLQVITDKAVAAGTAIGQKGVDAAQKFQNAVQTLKDKLQGAATEGLAAFTPEIEHITDLLNDPEFQKNLQATAEGIAAIGKTAIDAANGLVSLTRNYAEYLAKVQNGAGSFDLPGMRVERDNIQAELAQRAKHPVLSGINSFLAGSEDNIVQNALEGGRPRIQSMSTKDLQARLAQLDAGILHAAVRANAAPAKNPQEGDTRGLFVGLGGNQAPLVGDGGAAAAKLARDAANAQAQLTQSLIDLQGQLNPTAAIYAKFNATVKQATDEATLAKKAHGANAQAIDDQKQAVIDLAAKVRDAALDQLAEKDRQAWEALKRSFETPAQVRVEDALKQIQQLNDMLERGVITAQQYHDSLGQIGEKSVTGALPHYQGVDAAVSGPYGELLKNFQAETALQAAYNAQKLALDKKFNDQDEAQHAAHVAALNKLDADRAKEQQAIDQSRGTLQLQAASSLFGQLATLSSSHNKKMAAIGKAAAIAQTLIQTYQSATEAYAAMASIPYIGPALGAAAAAAAIVAGLANVAQIRSQNVGGYSEGGYTGPGGINQPAGIVHAGEVVWSQADVRRAGGVGIVESMRLRGYADGGYVTPFADAPSPTDLGLTRSGMPSVNMRDFAANDDAHARQAPPPVHVYAVFDAAELADKVMNSGPGHKVIVNVTGDNGNQIRGKWSAG